jgi:hypothetical protein
LVDSKFSVVSVCKPVVFCNYKWCKFTMPIKCGCSLFRTYLIITSCNCNAPKMSSLHIASSLHPWIWSCCSYIIGFCHLLDAIFFIFSITYLYVFVIPHYTSLLSQ